MRAAVVDGTWKLYVLNQESPIPLGQVVVMDWNMNITNVIQVGANPTAMDIFQAPGYDFLYVANYGSSSLYCIDMV